MRLSRWVFVWAGLALLRCSLTSSLDDLKGGEVEQQDSGGDVKKDGTGGTSSGGTAGTGGTGASDAQDAPPDVTSDVKDAQDPCLLSDACSACCASSHASGQQEYLDAIEKCVCDPDSGCSVTCSDYCNAGSRTQDCSNCVGSVQDCFVSSCASANCKVYLACVSACQT